MVTVIDCASLIPGTLRLTYTLPMGGGGVPGAGLAASKRTLPLWSDFFTSLTLTVFIVSFVVNGLLVTTRASLNHMGEKCQEKACKGVTCSGMVTRMKSWFSKLYGSEVKVQRLNDAPMLGQDSVLDNPQAVIDYLTPLLAESVSYRPETENMIVIHLTTRRRPISWQIISNGTIDTLLIHAREVFRAAIVFNAAAILLCHNHPSGDPSPSEADIKVTRDMIRAGQLLKIDVMDHVILGRPTPTAPKFWSSLRELGYFYT